ncbi:hypothetical protein SAMN05216360_101509 [Methylobacterium phyllostachyos]|uniref:Uncharacterized protein n=1 Tax=Methylobacterium phyllostachyos TaxID=582672 RepID=A0A1G9S6G2_9HYPH|nr:hypothetical protein [Methylobacterium phyllostachyos]SDM31004.1 hypothetical protein SAMN05216360_101509 [Methylobacterium phyllostachyos]
MGDVSWLGVVITFQVTFIKLSIAATVLIAGAYRCGWRSLLLGGVLGAAAVVALREGAATATLGVALGVAIIGALAATLGRTGVFRSVPPFLLDGAAAFMVVAYGSYFLASALADG